VAARLLHVPPPLAAREPMRHHEKSEKTRGFGLASSPLHFLVGGEGHHYL